MKNFEENLKRLETLAEDIKKSDISLEAALKDFEEGIKLSKSLEKELDSIEGKIQILMNSSELEDDNADSSEDKGDSSEGKKSRKSTGKKNAPLLDLFEPSAEVNGTRNG